MKFLSALRIATLSLALALGVSFAPPAQAQSSYDPCSSIQGTSVAKSSVAVAITTATTTSLIAPVTGSSIYVCSIILSISQVATTANIIKFQYGTGATCGTGTTDLTGALGTGGITAGLPVIINLGGYTLFSTPISQRLCAVTTIGATAAFSGVITYVQQ